MAYPLFSFSDMSARPVIYWFRKDLRLTDNTALHAAAQPDHHVIPVYILNAWTRQHRWTGAKRQAFLAGSLASLARNLEAIGSRLILRAGDAEAELEKLIRETQAQAVYFNRDYDPYGREMEKRVRSLCLRYGIECHSFKDRVLHEASEVLTGSGTEYRVYTPYSRTWLSLAKRPVLARVQSLGAAPPAHLNSLPLPDITTTWQLEPLAADVQLPEPGERAARQRMKRPMVEPPHAWARTCALA